MTSISANDFRKQVGEYINRTYYAKEEFVITKSGKQVAALVPVSLLERLQELEVNSKQNLLSEEAIGK